MPRPKHARRFRDYYEHEVQNFLDLQDEEDDSLEDSDSDESTGDQDLIYPILNVTKGQSIALWSCAKVDTIAIFTPGKGETMTRIVKYAEHHLGYDKLLHKLLMLNPGVVTPVDINTVYSIRPGAAIMVMPITSLHVTIEINQLKTHFDMTIDPACTVAKCKSQIKKTKGIPIDQQELLYRDKPMENNRRLLEYRVKNGGTIFVMIQAQFNLLINIHTFWGKTYRFYVDPCSTGTDVVYTVFTRTFSKNAPGLWDAGIHEFYVPIHILVLHFKKQLVHWDFCLAHMGVRSGDTLTLSTVGNHSSLSLKTITVVNEMDEQFQLSQMLQHMN
ncbi:hypothetical protein KUTeg_023759 [Tegillarca granosa]|uniref:Ubiquitin-like domain-containing protein n=1 Tax=Tegillarca granosa TaxID=220873 RepID=A0ABQ9E5V6_TEGGR|nr:hypothetical protein KUTeg_023759 [Tegillarca granosa]